MTRKIALISEHASPLAVLGGTDNGGQNVYVGEVARHLARGGYQVDVFTRKDSKSLKDIQEWKLGIRIIHVKAGPEKYVRKEELLPYIPEFTQSVLEFFQQEAVPYDLIHANFWMSGMVAMELKNLLGIPFVITFHALGRVRKLYQGTQDGFPAKRLIIEDQIVSSADFIIAECPQDEEDLIQWYQADPTKIQIVPCGFNPDELCPIDKVAARKELKLPKDEKIILQLGRMVPRKGVDNVIQALAVLREQYGITARLLIVGGESDLPDEKATPELSRLKSIAEQHGISKQVLFVGRKPRKMLKHFYSAADVFVSTPWYEPFGITPVESMACGTPVIGSRVGGIQFSVKDGETGFLVPPKDPDALAERLAFLYSNPRVLEKMRTSAIRRANQFFTWEQVAHSIAEVYSRVFREKQTGLDASSILQIEDRFQMAMDTFDRSRQLLGQSILDCAQLLISALLRGNKILICGNGGSAADAQHFAAELVGRFVKQDRIALPVSALTTDTSFLTAWANDIGFETVFSRQVEAYGKAGDVLIAISTTGQSKNLIAAFEAAHHHQMVCISLLGGDGGDLQSMSDLAIVVPTDNKQRIQEVQIFILHTLCELIEDQYSSRLVIASENYESNQTWEVQSNQTIKVPYSQDM